MSDEQGSSEELVHVDRIGTVSRPGDDLRATVHAPGLPEASRRRFEEDPRFTVADDETPPQDCDVALLSTRTPRGELVAQLEGFATATSAPVVALAHTGGEAAAAELVRSGAVSILGEGDESALASLLADSEASEGLLEAYDRNTASSASENQGRGVDPATGLLDELAMRAQVEELVHGGDLPRVAFARLMNLPDTPRELSYEGLGSLRRRIAAQFQHVAERHGATVFGISDSDFGLLGTDLSPNAAEGLARSLQDLAAAYVPTGVRPLALAFGHAGPEAATDGTMLFELAQRARDLAAQDGHGSIVSAELLALGMASSTELQATMQTLAQVERRSHHGVGHGERVAVLAADLASELGYDGLHRSRIRLAAHLHEIGKASLPREACADPSTLSGELLEAYRSHPVVGARYVQPIAGPEVAKLLRSYRERPDAGGFPDGLEGHDAPTGARIIAVAHAVEVLLARETGNGASLTAAVTAALPELQTMSGTELDDDIVEIACGMLSAGTLAGRSHTLAS